MDIGTADSMADLADELSRSEPLSERTSHAAEASLAAAQELARAGVPGARSRLARAWWRLASARAGAGTAAAQPDALRCWAVCLSLLDDPDPAEDQDRLVSRIAFWLGVVFPVLASTGRYPEAVQAIGRVARAAAAGSGPHALHARARLDVLTMGDTVQELSMARAAGRRSASGDLDTVIGQAAGMLKVLEQHAGDGPYEAGEFAEALRTAARLVFLNGDPVLALRMMDRACEVSAAIADQGPGFRAHADDVRAERDRFAGYASGG